MPEYLLHYELVPGPPEKLPVSIGFLEAAEEWGLLWVIQDGPWLHALPPGVVWGQFDGLDGLWRAFDEALKGVSTLLGFEARAARALATVLEDGSIPGWGAAKPLGAELGGADRYAMSLVCQLYHPPDPPLGLRRVCR
jgi:hypothetical protein